MIIGKRASLNIGRADDDNFQVKNVVVLAPEMIQMIQQRKAKQEKEHLHSTIIKCLWLPLQIELFYWMYSFYALCSACQTIVRIPFDLIVSSVNTFRPKFGMARIQNTSIFAVLIIMGYYIITQDYYFLDVSVLYHSFRGQSSVKLYGVGLALQISQKVLTLCGKYLLVKLQSILSHSKTSSIHALLEVFVCLIYCLAHFFSLYLDFILYIIVLNSSSHNMLMFFFVVNLGKMKAATFKKFQKNSFKNSLIYDAKDRFQKVSYSLLFMLTIPERQGYQTFSHMATVIIFCSLIDYLRHLTTLSMAGKQEELTQINKKICLQLFFQQNQDKKQTRSVMNCIKWDFTVIPYILLLLKFLSIIVWTNNKHLQFKTFILQSYIVLLLYVYIFAAIIFVLIQKFIPKSSLLQKPKNENPSNSNIKI